MNPHSCAEVTEQIELYALHECDAAMGAAVAQHLAGCLACARAYQQARQMLMLLDLTERGPALLDRLETRIAAQARRPQPPHLLRPPLRRVFALAALLLVTLALGWMVRPVAPTTAAETLVASLTIPDHMEAAHQAVPAAPGALKEPVLADAATVRRAVAAGRPPPPPALNLAVGLVNRGTQDVLLDLRPGRYDFLIDLTGPGVERAAAPAPAKLPFDSPGLLRLAPGAAQTLMMEHASEVEAGRVRYVYWTKPGRYILSVRLRIPIVRTPSQVWKVVTPPVVLEVAAHPE
jgi:hypothetical protein